MNMIGEQTRLFLETADGRVIDLTGMITEYTISMDYGPNNYIYDDIGGIIPARAVTPVIIADLKIVSGNFVFSDRDDFVDQMKKSREAKEWQCSYCFHINPRSARTCGEADKGSLGCGHARSFILE